MPIVQADRLSRIGAALLKAAGASDEEAGAVAVGCVSADLAGRDSHGVIAIPTCIDRFFAASMVTTTLTHVSFYTSSPEARSQARPVKTRNCKRRPPEWCCMC
jgi:LDH2 family malate/lactate/ureidoglycolate dehydrogenase